MKLKHVFALFIAMFLFFGCSKQPIGTSLLSSGRAGDSHDGSTSTSEDGELDIQPDNSAITVHVDDADKVEITGNCKDMDRKKNRIIVEVFAGDDETQDPYISNSVSDMCQNVVNDAGLFAPLTRCFWVTKGVGLIEDANLPTQRSFPQCHGGRFGFSLKLGKILVPSIAGPNTKYTVRFKLRTLDGILADSTYSRVSVARELNTPVIDSATYSITTTTLQCNVKTSPARFNFGVLHALTRTITDAAGTVGAPLTLYTGISTISILDGSSVFSWNDQPNGTTNIILQGVTYNYTLTSAETNFSYVATPPMPTAASTATTCKNSLGQDFTDTLRLSPTPPAPTANTCFMLLLSRANPNFGGAVTYEWQYNLTSNWVGADSNAQGTGILATCGNTTACTQAGLVAGTTYYFAVREKAGGFVSKWSDVFSCRPP